MLQDHPRVATVRGGNVDVRAKVGGLAGDNNSAEQPDVGDLRTIARDGRLHEDGVIGRWNQEALFPRGQVALDNTIRSIKHQPIRERATFATASTAGAEDGRDCEREG
jgi:hypothetical protein